MVNYEDLAAREHVLAYFLPEAPAEMLKVSFHHRGCFLSFLSPFDSSSFEAAALSSKQTFPSSVRFLTKQLKKSCSSCIRSTTASLTRSTSGSATCRWWRRSDRSGSALYSRFPRMPRPEDALTRSPSSGSST